MERGSRCNEGYKLESQIREAYGRVTYSQTARDKLIAQFESMDASIKMSQIILSAITTGSIITTLITNQTISSVIATILSTLLLVLNSYVKNFNLIEKANEHKSASDLLWKIREEYISLLTDFNDLSVDLIREKRDELQIRTHEVYQNSPRTSYKSYLKAQKALKSEEEQTFSDDELDLLLPTSLRRDRTKR